MYFRSAVHQALLGPTGAHCVPGRSTDLSCKDSTRQNAVDSCPRSCNGRLGFGSPRWLRNVGLHLMRALWRTFVP